MTTLKKMKIPSSVSGKELNTVLWECPEPKAVLQIAHGMAEHIMRYDGFARWMNEKGVVVAGNDHLGHGQTAENNGELGFFAEKNGWEYIVEDVERVRKKLSEMYPGLPYFIFGHSMGSFVVRTYITKDWAKDISGAIISGTGNVPAAAVSAGSAIGSVISLFCGKRHRSNTVNGLAFGSYNKAFVPARTDFDWLTKDEAVVDEYIADEKCGYVFTCRAYKDLFHGLKFIGKGKNIAKVRKDLPVLFISGDKDPVGDSGRGVAQVFDKFRKAGIKDVSMKLYEGDRHEILNELDKETVYADCLAFIERVSKTAQ